MAIEDAIKFNFSLRMGKVKLLANGVVFVNVLGILGPDIKLVTINLVRDEVSQVLDLVYPWKRIST